MPDALAGRDVLGRGQTGSGKTLAFGLPMLARLAAGGRARPHQPKALILVPTRELAMQVNDALMPLAKSVGALPEDRRRRRAVRPPDRRAASAASTCSSPPRAGSAT